MIHTGGRPAHVGWLLAHDAGEQPGDAQGAADDAAGGHDLAAAVAATFGVAREERDERGDVARPHRGEERRGARLVLGRGRGGLAALARQAAAGARDELAAGELGAAEDTRDLGVREPEHLVQDEGRALARAQPLEHHQEGGRQALVQLGQLGGRRLVDQRLGQPRPHVGPATAPRRAPLVDGQAGAGRDEPGARGRDRRRIHPAPAQERFLDHVVRIGDRAEHPVGEAAQQAAVLLEHGQARVQGQAHRFAR